MNGMFFPWSIPYPHLTGGERGGGCHFHGNLIYHKRISFVTWPSNGGTSSERTHTQTRTHDEGRVRSSGGDDLKERKKKLTVDKEWIACLQPQLSTFGEGSQKGTWRACLVRSPGNFQNGFRAKNKSTGKRQNYARFIAVKQSLPL